MSYMRYGKVVKCNIPDIEAVRNITFKRVFFASLLFVILRLTLVVIHETTYIKQV